ncbi:MAG TPA: hypothetical protein PLQ04_08890 [Lachnospiraceae bacterium]|nr:hypothetical protein [Lachnospiraceae bacterium]
MREYSKWPSEEPVVDYITEDYQEYTSKYDVAFRYLTRENYTDDNTYQGYFSQGLSTEQIDFIYDYLGNTLLDQNYATSTTDDFIVQQQIDGLNVRYFDGEMISDTQIQGWSDDEYSDYLNRELITENKDYITSSTYSFDSNENLIDIGVIYIFESEIMAEYYYQKFPGVAYGPFQMYSDLDEQYKEEYGKGLGLVEYEDCVVYYSK